MRSAAKAARGYLTKSRAATTPSMFCDLRNDDSVMLAEARAANGGFERMFPIQGGPAIPLALIEPHDRQAQRNHDQDLATLARRGGLSPCEAVAVLEDRAWHRMDDAVALRRLNELVDASLQLKLDVANARIAALESMFTPVRKDLNAVADMLCGDDETAIVEKRRHRIITVAAAALNWHAAVSGTDTSMRPGIETPTV
jgi:hypothetical protein